LTAELVALRSQSHLNGFGVAIATGLLLLNTNLSGQASEVEMYTIRHTPKKLDTG